MIESNDETELDLTEISALFKSWSNKSISVVLILDLLLHFYPDVVIENNKYVLNMKCNLLN